MKREVRNIAAKFTTEHIGNWYIKYFMDKAQVIELNLQCIWKPMKNLSHCQFF